MCHRLLATTPEELPAGPDRGIDVLLVSADPYIDHPSFGTAVLGRVLEDRGYRVGICAQPDWTRDDDFVRFGRPRLWCGISGGTVDSILANYTVNRKKRRDDMFGPGGRGGTRPNRATIVYANRIRACFPGLPIVLGGIEAATRRFAHYDWWDNKIRRAILFDARADLVVWGEGERVACHVTERLAEGAERLWGIPGTAIRIRRSELDEALAAAARYFAVAGVDGQVRPDWHAELAAFSDEPRQARYLPGHDELAADKDQLIPCTAMIEQETRVPGGHILVQPHGDHCVVSYPRARYLTTDELDAVAALPFTRLQHPATEAAPALASIQTSVITHRGCPGGCTFCAITVHAGKTIRSRSAGSILAEVEGMTKQPFFRGTVSDLGGPSANLYGMGCRDEQTERRCQRPSCFWPAICPNFQLDPEPLAGLLADARSLSGVRHAYIASGLRHDVLLETPALFRDIVQHHTGGRLKLAPEHGVDHVLDLMRKPGIASFRTVVRRFKDICRQLDKPYWIVPYFLSSFPGASDNDAWAVKGILSSLGMRVDQVQDFWPAPMTLAAAMYWAEKDPSGRPIPVAKTHDQRARQKACVRYHDQRSRRWLKAMEKKRPKHPGKKKRRKK